MVLELTVDTFEKEVIHSSLPVLVDFWAEWCGPCKMLAPVLEEISGEYAGKLKFVKISTQDYPELAAAHQILGIPCLIIFHHGEEADRIVGFYPREQLRRKINAILERT